jgi:hypothetical protein
VTVRLSVRIAGLAILAAQIAASAPRTGRPAGLVALVIIIALQLIALMWSTRAGSAEALKVVAPVVLTGVSAAAAWTALAFVAPGVASRDTLALVAIAGAGIVVGIWPPRGTGRRRVAVLGASATTALLIFMVISAALPAFDGFVSNWHPPVYTDVTRLVDPVLELALFVVLSLALCADLLWARARRRRTAASERGVASEAAPNEMVVLPPNPEYG